MRRGDDGNWRPARPQLSDAWDVARLFYANHGRPRQIISYLGGVGDEIMCTSVAHELARRGGGRSGLLTTNPDLFRNEPCCSALPFDYRIPRALQALGVRHLRLKYPDNPPRHFIVEMCRQAGVTGRIEVRPRLSLSPEEQRMFAGPGRARIVVQSSCSGARYAMRNKDWGPERMQAVVDQLSRSFEIVQVGVPSEPPLAGCTDLRDRLSLREVAALLASARLFIGLAGGLMHLTRAIDGRAVIIYGGREKPRQSGYVAFHNLSWEGACSPCWVNDVCDHGRVCMTSITPHAVLSSVEAALAEAGTELPVEYADD